MHSHPPHLAFLHSLDASRLPLHHLAVPSSHFVSSLQRYTTRLLRFLLVCLIASWSVQKERKGYKRRWSRRNEKARTKSGRWRSERKRGWRKGMSLVSYDSSLLCVASSTVTERDISLDERARSLLGRGNEARRDLWTNAQRTRWYETRKKREGQEKEN